ncbi:MAG: hypothetical protein JO366_09400 [Methylobacteriaceae bacterium]|nr:hypothetical protein [Methylobacteriaceae bacterium]
MQEMTYSFRPSLFHKGELAARLEADAIVVGSGEARQRIAFSDIMTIRVFSAPVSARDNAGFCSIVPQRGRTISLRSTSFAGLGRFEDRSAAYQAFVGSLVARAAAANPGINFIGGPSRAVWWCYLVVAAAAVLLLAASALALISGALPVGSAAPLAIVALFLPTCWGVVRRGGPRRFDPRVGSRQSAVGSRPYYCAIGNRDNRP